MEEELCWTCLDAEPHGYVQGTGEYLSHTCLPCHRRSRKQPNFFETSSGKNNSKTPSAINSEDK